MRLVVDASVAVKWFFRDRTDESQVDEALKVLSGVATGAIELIQPPHFIAEVSAVLAREAPEYAQRDLRDLQDILFSIRDDAAVYARAMKLAIQLDHHLFDTLYHAVALETPGAVLVTADRRYLAKVKADDRVCSLTASRALISGKHL